MINPAGEGQPGLDWCTSASGCPERRLHGYMKGRMAGAQVQGCRGASGAEAGGGAGVHALRLRAPHCQELPQPRLRGGVSLCRSAAPAMLCMEQHTS